MVDGSRGERARTLSCRVLMVVENESMGTVSAKRKMPIHIVDAPVVSQATQILVQS